MKILEEAASIAEEIDCNKVFPIPRVVPRTKRIFSYENYDEIFDCAENYFKINFNFVNGSSDLLRSHTDSAQFLNDISHWKLQIEI